MNLPFSKITLDQQTRESYAYLLKWAVLAVAAGMVGATVVHLFSLLVGLIASGIAEAGIPLWAWPIAGSLVAGGVIYRLQKHAAGEGIPSYIRGIRIHKGDLLFSVTFYKFWAALATIATFGNGGVVGPLGRVTSGLVAFLEKQLAKLGIGFVQADQRTAAICGLAGAVGAIFHTSIGGGIFAVEIIQRAKMGYKDIFPAILSSSTAVFLCRIFGWGGFYEFNTIREFMDSRLIGWLLLLCLLSGLLGGMYTALYAWLTRVFRRKEGRVLLKVMAGSAVAALIGWGLNPALMGTSKGMISAIIAADLSNPLLTGGLAGLGAIGLVLVIMLLAKTLCNCITVGSGMSAGFTGPAAITGMLLGAVVAHYAHVDHYSPDYYALIAAGFSGTLASCMNIPLAAAIMATEIFGLQSSFPAALAAVIGFQVTRASTIYDYALAGAGLAVDE